MKKLSLLIAILLGTAVVFAQMPAGMKPGSAVSASAHIYGKLTDNDGKAH